MLKTSNFEPLLITKKGAARGQSSKNLRSSHHFTVRPFMGNNNGKGGSEANSPRSRSNLDGTKLSSASEDEDLINPLSFPEPVQDKSLMTWEEA